jgi:RHS repeat-associated protein
MPHASGAGSVWTTYVYDALGRTTGVTNPDGSAKSYQYVANTVRVTDETGKWKKYWMDGYGNLTQVQEPDPANPGSASYYTNYTYDLLGHLISVNMPRPTGTQTRTFNYGTPPGPYLLSATNPENGTVSYTYTWYGAVATKTDAKNQQVRYTYDDYRRLTQVSYYYWFWTGQWMEDTAARVTVGYDTNSVDGTYSQYASGRTTTRTYTINGRTFTDMYSYTQAGQVAGKRLRVAQGSVYADLNGSWSYDNEGRVTSVTYPAASGGGGQTYTYGFDANGRLNTMVSGGTGIISGATYGPAGELLTMSGTVSESRSYNSRLQLTSFNGVTFSYPAANNGKIESQTNAVSGEQITYQYDALNRLISAVTTDNPNVTQWGQGFTYDGFGNLREKTVTKGSAPVLSVGVSAATNRVDGYSYDANGNQLQSNTQTLSYDYENRAVTFDNRDSTGTAAGYDADNRRVYSARWTNGENGVTYSDEVVHYFGAGGQWMGSYQVNYSAGPPVSLTLTLYGDRAYFGGKLVMMGTTSFGTFSRAAVAPDRLGSVGTYFPYGEGRGSGGGMFATYTRDAGGLDYAMNRYYNSNFGRFMTADPYRATAGSVNNAADPGSWNRYGYVGGDPVNLIDSGGLDGCSPDDRLCFIPRPIPYYPYSPGGGGGPKPLVPLDPPGAPQKRLQANYAQAILSAIAALKDPKCGALFNTDPNRPHTYTPSDVLAGFVFGGSDTPDFGTLTIARMSLNYNAVTVPDPNTSVSIGNGTVAASANIVLQGNPLSEGFYLAQSTQDLALTLIHELGHVFNIVIGLGGSNIVWDANPDGSVNYAAENTNADILRACNPK